MWSVLSGVVALDTKYCIGMILSHKLQALHNFSKRFIRGQLVSIQREPISPIRHVCDGILMVEVAISNIILQKAWSV